ncbi:GerAB/ArcD/ProY family transporter [Caproiciproducens sp.]|uniref:GerAB/ArcD/ProY family transporter n=1 Tax=Caproiciproducens sp. TaxID=1954376 RepID=UPI0028A09E28|nr:endospore germination permease [Caproiciproducens sp.]
MESWLIMQEKDTITTKQYIWLLFSVITSFSTLQIVSMLIAHAGEDAWLSVICAWLTDVALAVVYAYMGRRFPGENMVQYSISVLGKYFGRLIGALFIFLFLISVSVLIRSLCTLLGTAFFPETPLNVLIAFCFILIAIGAKKGLKVFARISAFLGPIYLLGFIVLFVSLAPLINLDGLKPLLYRGIFPFLSGAPFLLSYIGICIIMGMYIPYCSKPENGFKGKFISVTLGSVIFELEVISGICIFGPEQAGIMTNVGLQLAKIVSIGGVFERLEAMFLMISVAAGIISAMSLIWAFSLGTAQIAGLSTYKPIVYPSALLAFIITVTSFDNSTDIYNFVNYTFPFIALFIESGLECFLLIMAFMFKKRGCAK